MFYDEDYNQENCLVNVHQLGIKIKPKCGIWLAVSFAYWLQQSVIKVLLISEHAMSH